MKSWLKKRLAFGLVLSLFVLMLAACEAGGGKEGSSNTSGNAAANAGANAGAGAPAEEISLADLEKKAKEEGSVVSVGMPDSWANWKDTWADLLTKYLSSSPMNPAYRR